MSLYLAAYVDQIINLSVLTGESSNRAHEFYESTLRNQDALQTMGEGTMLKGPVLPALNKSTNIKADLVRTDEEWEMGKFEKAL